MKGLFDGLVGKAKEIGGKIAGALNPGNWVKGVANALGGGNKVAKSYIGAKSFRGGLTTVAEKGAEMITLPNGISFLAGQEMLMNLPQGTEIQTAESTKKTIEEMTGFNNKSTTSNNTVTNSKTEKNNNKIVFSPVVHIYNSKDEDNIDKKILDVMNRFFEEKIIGIGG